jgi:Transcriptional regulators
MKRTSMEVKYDTISRINDKFNRMSKSHKKIATFIIDHYEQAAFMTASKLGKTVGISESTVVRFAYALEYEGYPEFQEALAEWVKDKLNSVQKIGAKYGKSTQSEILTSVLNADIEKIDDTIDHVDPQAFEAAVDIILNAKHVYLIGLRSCKPLAEFLHFYLNMIRSDVILLDSTSTSELFEQMLRINEKDAIIGISFPRYSMRTLKAMEMATDRNAKVITITDTIHSPMCLYSSCNLMARSDMVSIVDSLVAPLSLINALVVALCLKRPNEVKKNLETLESVWDNYQVYLKDEINFIDEEMLNTPLQTQMEQRRRKQV